MTNHSIYMSIRYFALIVIVAIGLKPAAASEINIPKKYFYNNYTKSEYKASPQNWDAVQDENNIMYFANSFGVLYFDGIHWQLIPVENKSLVRSLRYLGNDSIAYGAYSEFGVLFRDNAGTIRIESWKHLIPEEYSNFEEIWNIHSMGDILVFQSFRYIFMFRDKKLLKVIASHNHFLHSFWVEGNLYVQEIGEGLYRWDGSNLLLVLDGEFYHDKEIWSILPYNNGNLLIGTQKEGCFVYDGAFNKQWKTPANDFLISNNLYSALLTKNGKYAFGSIQNGLLISDRDGKIESVQNKALGLQNNTVLSIFEDCFNNLWLGLDNGIDYIKINSDFSFVRKLGGFGTGYSSVVFDHYLYTGTNQGVYYLPLHEHQTDIDIDFEPLNSLKGQVWKLKTYGDKLYCCHNNGLFIINDLRVKKIGDITGPWDFIPLPENPQYLLIGTYNGFWVMDSNTQQLFPLEGFSESSRRFVFDRNGFLWVSHGFKGIYKLKINLSAKKAELLGFYNSKNKLDTDYGNEIFVFENQPVITNEKAVLEVSDSVFAESPILTKIFDKEPFNITNIISDSDNKYWIFKDGKLEQITYLNQNMYEIRSKDFLPIANTFVKSFENILAIDKNKYLIGNENGFILYESNSQKNSESSIRLGIESISYKQHNSQIFSTLAVKKNGNNYNLGVLEYYKRTMKITLTLPYYINQNLGQIRYKINNQDWSIWSNQNEINLSSLRENDYNILIQSSSDGKEMDSIISISFELAPPVYRRWYAFLFYLLVISAILYASYSISRRMIEADKRRELLKQKKEMQANEIKLKQEAEVAQNELIKLKNETLQTDVRRKSKELANTTMSIIQKNKMLQEINEILQELGQEDIRYRDNKKINSLVRKINKEIEHQDNWTVFEKNFDKVHENFLLRLKEQHGNLSPKDFKLAAYLRMNLSSKEIAPLMNISIRSVEISRYRLRKKLGIEHDQNLTEYLITL